MESFYFERLDAHGQVSRGVVQGKSYGDAKALLSRSESRLVLLRPQQFLDQVRSTARVLKTKLLVQILQSIYDFLNSGQTLERSLDLTATLYPKVHHLKVLHAAVLEGHQLSQALCIANMTQSKDILNTLEVGEAAGRLEEALTGAIQQIKTRNALRDQMLKTLTYPILLFCISFGLMCFLTQEMIPQVMLVQKTILDPTRASMAQENLGAIQFLSVMQIVIKAILLLFVFVPMMWGLLEGASHFSPLLRAWKNRFYRSLGFMRSYFLADFYQFYKMLDQIMPGQVHRIIEQLSMLNFKNGYDLVLQDLAVSIGQGRPLGQAMKDLKLISRVDLQMLDLGQATNTLAKQCAHLSQLHRDRLTNGTRRTVNIVGPVMLSVVGVMLVTIILSIFLPLYSSFEQGL